MFAMERGYVGLRIFVGVALLASLILPYTLAMAEEERPVIVIPRASGQVLFQTCATCHRYDGRGGATEGGFAANLQETKLTHEEIVAVISDGRMEKGMPSFKGFLDDFKINALAKFIKEDLKAKEN